MDRGHKCGALQRPGHCRYPGKSFGDDLVARLRQISLTSTLCEGKSWNERVQECCRTNSARRSLLKTDICRAATYDTSSFYHRLHDWRYLNSAKGLPCVHLCVIGKKMTLHKRNHDQNSFFVRARNYSRRLKERQEQVHHQVLTRNQNPLPLNVNKCSNHGACQQRLPSVRLPTMSDDSSNSASTIASRNEHRYAIYFRPPKESEKVVIMLPKEPANHLNPRNVQKHHLSVDDRQDSGCISSMSFSSIDLTAACRSPDDSSCIGSPPPPKAQELYPVACPAYPMVASFPMCVIPEPDV